MKKRSFLLIPLLSLVCSAQSIADADVPVQAVSPVSMPAGAAASVNEELIQKFIDEMKEKIYKIEDAIRLNNADSAHSMAKSLFDDAKVKLGIDPQFKIQTAIPIAINLTTTDFGSMNQYDKDTVIAGVKSFRGGMLLETIKFYKKACLLYARTSYLKYLPKKPQQKFSEEDRLKIVEDLAKATLIPLIIVGSNNTKMTIFESDVIQPDATYDFNREIVMFLDKSRFLTSDNFEAYQKKIIAHFKTPEKPKSAVVQPKVSNETIYASPDFEACYNFSLRGVSGITQYEATSASSKCLRILRSGFSKFKSRAFEICYNSNVPRSHIIFYETSSAVEQCVANLTEPEKSSSLK